MNKLLSVIIPTYNMEKYLDRCLSSLIIDNKDLMDLLEVLVINDGSTDKSSELAHQYERNFPQTFRVIDKENGNYGSCVNRGIKEATGKYVKVLDADDSFNSNVLENYLNTLNKVDADLFITDGYNFMEKQGKKIEWRVGGRPHQLLPVGELPSLWMLTITYRTEILHKVNYHQTEGISYTDEEWAFWPMAAVQTFYYIPICLYCYTLEREGQTMSSSVWVKKCGQEIQISLPMIEFLHGCKGDEPAYGYLQRKLYTRLRHFYYRVIVQYRVPKSDDIVAMDRLLQEKLPSLSAKLSEDLVLRRQIPIHYLRCWRSHDYNIPVYHPCGVVIQVLRFLSAAKHRLGK